MCAVHRAATTVLTASRFVPLLTELGSHHAGHYYKHGAPNGAVLWALSQSTGNSDEPPAQSLAAMSQLLLATGATLCENRHSSRSI